MQINLVVTKLETSFERSYQNTNKKKINNNRQIAHRKRNIKNTLNFPNKSFFHFKVLCLTSPRGMPTLSSTKANIQGDVHTKTIEKSESWMILLAMSLGLLSSKADLKNLLKLLLSLTSRNCNESAIHSLTKSVIFTIYC